MASAWGFVKREMGIFFPTVVAKTENPLKFGILGAAKIAPGALIGPAKTHPDVVVHAVAARDQAKAAAYAKKHGIPHVHTSYQDLLDDPAIDAVYIPLPNGLHFEWALRALKAGKHVLLEKPSVSNAAEAERLFRSPLLSQPGAPVLLEAFHYRFHPAWQLFLSLVDRPNLATLHTEQMLPRYIIPADDIRFQYALAGGAVMDFGTYAVNAMRQIWAAEPEECLRADLKVMPPPEEHSDYAHDLRWRMPGGGVADNAGSLRSPLREGLVPTLRLTVTHREAPVDDSALPAGQATSRTRRLLFFNYMMPPHYHRIDVEDHFITRGPGGEVLREWTRRETRKAYTFREAGLEGPGDESWTTYRHQLEQFVNRIRGRETRNWVDAEDSIAQMKALDMVYRKAGLPLRPTSDYE